jgi:hypothetical protein
MLDQHIALSYAYRNPALGGTLFRWNKDLKRYNMLVEHYPLPESPEFAPLKPIPEVPEPSEITIPEWVLSGNCLSGYAAHAFYSGNGTFSGNLTSIRFTTTHPEILIYTDRYIEMCEIARNKLKHSGIEYWPVLGWVPKRTEFPMKMSPKTPGVLLVICDNLGDLLGADSGSGSYHISGVHHVLLYMLLRDDIESYQSLINIINEKKLDPTVNYYASLNIPESHKLYIDKFDGLNLLKRPRNIYPVHPECNASEVLDYSGHIFRIDGSRI